MIINSVIAGKGGGDEVEAYALGDAKNAVKDDKVSLNFSAGILPIEESVTVSSSTEYFYTGYAKNTEAVFLSSNYAYVFKKNSDGVWSNTSTTSFGSQDGANKRCSPFGLLIDLYAGTGFKVTNGYLTSLDYPITGRSYEPRDRALFSTTGEYCAVFSNTGSGYKTVVYYKNSLLQVLDEWSGASYDSVPRFFFANKDGVEYLFVGTTVSASVHTPHTYRLTPAGAEYLGMFSVSKQNGDNFTIDATASVGDLLITSSSAENITLSNIGMFKVEVDPTQKTVVLKDASKEFTSFTSVLKDSLGFPTGDGLNLVPTGDVNIIQYRNGCVKYNPSEGTFEPYLPTGVMSDRVFYNADEKVVVKIIDNTTRFNLYRLLQPVEQPYVATTFTDRSYCSSSGLTGIVQENDNGVLKVSTVEDPNNPPPAIPDEYGLETTINYGSAEGVNGEVSSALTVSSDTSVSGFYGNAGAVVRAKNPFVDYSGTINSFEVVIPATMTDSDSNYHMLGYFGENSSGNMGLLIYYSGRWILRLKFEGDSNYTDLNAGSSATLNTKTLVKVTYDSSTGYTLWLSTDDGGSWTNSGASTTTTRLINRFGDFVIGGEGSSTDGWRGSIDFKGLYVKINNEEVYNGIAPVFGSVSVGYGYFRNTLTKPSDKYVPYYGGVLTEDNIGPVAGVKATTMNIVLGRNADMGSWTSDTEGYLSTQDSVAASVNKKLPTPVYLWHDLSYITPAVPETIEAVVETGGQTDTPSAVNGTIEGSPTIGSDFSVSGFSSSNYIHFTDPFRNKDVTSFEAVLAFSPTSDNVYQILMIIINALTMGRKTLSFDVVSSASLLAKVETVNGQKVSISCGAPTAGKKTWLKLTYDSSSGYAAYTSYDGISYTMTGSDPITDKPDVGGADIDTQGVLGVNLYPGAESQYTRGTIHLPDCYINVNGQRVWDGVVYEINKGSVSIPTASWKTLDGVVYEYPEGFPETQAGDLEANIVEGSNNLYATRTGDSCGLAISSTSPAGVDSSAVIGTVELDANGVITSYTPGE